MKIKNFEVIPFNIPMIKPLKWASGYMDAVNHILLRIEGEDGTFGIAEGVPRPMIYGETQESMYYALKKYFAPLIIGEDSFNLERIWTKMDSIAYNFGCKSAIDVALHDLNGKLLDMPIYRLIGGPYRNKIEICHMVGLDDKEMMIKEVKDKIALGFRSFKIKGGIDPDDDISLIIQLREVIPQDVRLYLDANQRYDKETAFRVLSRLVNSLDSIEEPMAIFDSIGRKKLSQKTNIPIIADESVFSIADVRREIELGAVKRIGLKIPRTGFYTSKKIINLCEAFNIKLQICSQGETSLGTVACLHLAAAYKQISHASEMMAYSNVVDSLIKNSLIVKDGFMETIDGPGLGVEIDWEKVKKYSITL